MYFIPFSIALPYSLHFSSGHYLFKVTTLAAHFMFNFIILRHYGSIGTSY